MNRQRGFGLIEALISMLVFAVGAVALVKLQGELIQGGGNANARSVALSIAQEKLDDLRAFQCKSASDVANNICNTASSPLNPKPAIFTEIGPNTGGGKKKDADGGGLRLPSGNIPRGNTVYALSWGMTGNNVGSSAIAQPAIYNAATNAFVEGASTTVRRVRVNVSWTDPDGTVQTVSLEDEISDKPPSDVALAMLKEGGQSMEGVDVPDSTTSDNLGVDVGGGAEQKTTDPQMYITQNDQFVETQIETVTYAGDPANPNATRREASLVINCECKQSGSGLAAEPARDELVFDSTGNNVTGRITRPGAIVNKPVGERINTGQAGQQSELCNECCRDHHDDIDASTDPDKLAQVYDPWRPTGSDSNGNPFYLANHDHSHFFPDGAGVLQAANNLGDTYLESCRLQRVGGVFRVMQDWNLATIKVMPECFLEGGCPLGSGIAGTSTDYLNYVTQFVKDYVNALDSANPAAIPTVTTSFNNEPDEVKMSANETMQMVARAVYIDFLTPNEINKLQGMDSVPNSFLALVPFEQVNMTKLANWCTTTPTALACPPPPANNGNNLATVTSQPVENDDNYSRGLVTALKEEPFVTTTLQFSNTGFLGFESLLTVDEHDGPPQIKSDSLQLKIGGGAATPNTVVVTMIDGVNPTIADHQNYAIQMPDPNPSPPDDPVTCAGTCTLDANGDGQIRIVKYNSASEERMVCYKTDIPAVSIAFAVTGSKSNEVTTFTIDGAIGSFTMTFDVVLQGAAVPAGFTACVP